MTHYLDEYLKSFADQGKESLAKSIRKTANNIASGIGAPAQDNNKTGLLYGNIQSGKTSHAFGVICKAADMGYSVFLIITTGNALQQQTLARAKKDLKGFNIYDEKDVYRQNGLNGFAQKPSVVVMKKQSGYLDMWNNNVFNDQQIMGGKSLLIIDDEADAFSLDYKSNKSAVTNTTASTNPNASAINQRLTDIRNSQCLSSIYLQVTGTPQAVLLQPQNSGWKPDFTYYFEPGQSYLGGDFFFPENQKKPEFINYIKDGEEFGLLGSAIMHHLAVSAQIFATGGKVCNLLIHPHYKTDVQKNYKELVKSIHNILLANTSNQAFEELLKKEWEKLRPHNHDKVDYQSFLNCAKDIINNNEIKVLVMNSKNTVSNTEYSTGSNIIIGGNVLGRGLTIPSLHTYYYIREVKSSVADTKWQHCRMFGYDRDPGMVQVYLTESLYNLFTEINATNNAIIDQINAGSKQFILPYHRDIAATRSSVLNTTTLFKLNNRKSVICIPDYNMQLTNDTFADISQLLNQYKGTDYSEIFLTEMIEILSHVTTTTPNFDKYIDVIKSIEMQYPGGTGILIIHETNNQQDINRMRYIMKKEIETLGIKTAHKVVLMMYNITCNNPWNPAPIWVPTIQLPDDTVYYYIN